MQHYLQVTDEHLRRATTQTTEMVKDGAEFAPALDGTGTNRDAQSFRSESVTMDSAMRNTHLHAQVGVTRWANLVAMTKF
jgi:hypothetical protein